MTSQSSSDPPQGAGDPPQPSSLGGRYQLLGSLGQGGMADVYLAVARGPLGFNKLVVLKRLRASADDDGRAVQMFLDEARIAARLNHPNIVDTYDVGQEIDSHFIAMEYLDGQPLNRLLKMARATGVHPSAWVYIVSEALRGLHHAHQLCDYDGTSLQIVHRDVSPHNIFVTFDGEVKVVDFGVAKATLNLIETEAGFLKGKIGYMAPEQALGSDVDRRADIFSMGVVLWEAVAERRLLEGGMATVVAKLVHSEVPKLSDARPDVDRRLSAIVERALQKQPGARYASAAEMREALLDFLESTPNAAGQIEIARMMAGLFGQHRTAVQREVEKRLARATTGGHEHTTFWESTKLLLSYDPSVTSYPAVGTATDPRRAYYAAAKTAPVSLAPGASAKSSRQPDAPHAVSYSRIAVFTAAIGAAAAAAAVGMLRYAHEQPSTLALMPSTDTVSHLVPVAIESTPSGAEVSWNGQAMGRTPVTLQLPRGAQTVIVSKEDYSTEPIVIEVNGTSASAGRLVTLKPAAAINSAARATRMPAAPRAPAPIPPPPLVARAKPPIVKAPVATNEIDVPAPSAPPSEAPAVTPPVQPMPEPPPEPTLSPGSMDAKGIGQTIMAHGGEIQACFDRARMDRADLHGRLTIQATIGPTGRVLSASATRTIEGGARLSSCVLSAWESWTFPPPAGGISGSFSKTFVFE